MLPDFVIGFMAVWRLSSLIVQEKGPFNIFVKIRKLAKIEHDDTGEVVSSPDTFWGGLLSCVWCSSVWISGFWTACYILNKELTMYCSIFLALSAGAIWLNKVIRG
jgi:hypothetical protein